jgi:hypothetical protein
MTDYTLKNLNFIENSDYQFQISFEYKNMLITTPNIDRESSKADIQTIMLNTVKLVDQKRSDDNYENLKKQFNNKETLIVSG